MKENFENVKWFWNDFLSVFDFKKWYLFPYFILAFLFSLPITLFFTLLLLTEDSEERKRHEAEIEFILNQHK